MEENKFHAKLNFTASSKADEVARDISLKNKVVIVTGANTGIGKETAKVLAKRGATVFMVCRDVKRGEDARTDILQEISSTFSDNLKVMKCDLGSFQSIEDFAIEWLSLNLPLHILVNNAGIMACPRSTTVDGYETQFGVNHLGHFLLTNLLLSSLKKAGNSRVVVVSSLAHTSSGIRFDVCGKTTIYDEWFGDWKAYGISKTANVLFSVELDKRYKQDGIRSNSLHPGTIATELARNNSLASTFFSINPFIKTVPEGAATTVLVATAPELEGIGGRYFADCNFATPKSYAIDPNDSAQLWDLSAKMVSLEERLAKVNNSIKPSD